MGERHGPGGHDDLPDKPAARPLRGPSRVVDPTFRDVPWAPDPAEPWKSGPGGIAIEAQDAWHRDLVERRPALIVKDHALRPVRSGIADRLESTRSRDGFDRYATPLNSSNTVVCISGSPRSAKRLATEVTRELVQFSDAIRRNLGLVRFQVLERGETAVLEESRRNFAAPVTIAWQIQETWVVREQVPVLTKVLTSVAAELARR